MLNRARMPSVGRIRELDQSGLEVGSAPDPAVHLVAFAAL